nr:MAG TPA: hypothetical protein [Caudoviricetes sp.]
MAMKVAIIPKYMTVKNKTVHRKNIYPVSYATEKI